MDSSGGRNPGACLFYLDADTLIPLNYEQYRIDLSSLIGKKIFKKNTIKCSAYFLREKKTWKTHVMQLLSVSN